MNSLTTRKIVLGLLMALVLTFSVQGIADALTLDKGDGDFTSPSDDGPFSITFTPSLTDSDTGTTFVENETVKISVSPTSRAKITGIGTNGNITPSKTSYTLKEGGTGIEELSSGEVPVYFSALSPGEVTITVSDGTSSTQLKKTEPNTPKASSLVFSVYITKHALDVNLSDTVSLSGVTNGIGAGYDDRGDVKIHTGSGDNPVTYTVSGGGILYIKDGTRYLNADGSYIKRDDSDSGTLVTSGRADVWLSMASNSRTVTAEVTSGVTKNQGVYIYGRPTLTVTPTPPATLSGASGSVTETNNAITVVVADQAVGGGPGDAVSDVPVKFDVVDKSVTGGYLIPPDSVDTPPNDGFSDNIFDASRNPVRHANPLPARTLYVRSDANAAVGFQFGTAAGKSEVTVSISGKNVNVSKKVEVVVEGGAVRTLSISDNTRRSGTSKLFDLVAVVKENEKPVPGVRVTFETRFGDLESTVTGQSFTDPDNPADDADPVADTTPDSDNPRDVEGLQVTEITDRLGRAHVIYDLGNNTGRQEIDASIYDDDPDRRQEKTFVINGSAGVRDDDLDDDLDDDVDDTTNTVTVIPGSLSGAPGAVASLAVAAGGATVRVTGSSAFTTAGGTVTGIGAAREVTLPNTAGDYSLTVSASGYDDGTVPVTVTAAASTQLGTLSITAVGARVGTQQQIQVASRNTNGTVYSGALVVTLTGAANPPTVTTLNGTVTVIATLPTATSAHTLTVSATRFTSNSVTIPAGGQSTTTQQPTTTTRTVAGEADSIEIDGQRRRSGTVNEAARLRVRVLDANDNGVSDVRVTFRVLAPGRGTFSGSRGNGRAVPDQTDRSGYASASLTPSDDGDLIVRASAAGVSADVTFIIDVGEASTTGAPDTGTPGTATPRATTSRAPVVHVGAASRPPMLWVDGGAIYALVGASPQRFAPSVDNALNLAIGGGKVYWTEKTGESGGTINSANLDGTGVTELASIFATPIGIAVDTAGSKLYWTNSSGRIQSANLDGSRITNVLQNLPGPMDIAVARGIVYWTQFDATALSDDAIGVGNVGIVNPTAAQTVARYISTGSDTPGSIVIGGSKVYWTEMTGESGGTVNSANLNGTGATQLASILAAPIGIAVDTARSKLYWTNARGRIQSANLNGSGITNVVSGLGSPGEIVLSNSITAPTAATTTTTTTASNKYDVNGDGAVDAKDSDVLIIAVAAEVTDAKYDVNGDGKVDINDVVAVRANRDPGAAGAPTLVGMKFSAVQIDRLQEQIDLLIATNDRSPAALRTLIYLQQLLVTARPEKTQLLANYPNPFNPETWIPYELATDTDVRITIYNTQGVVIRSLQFGHQSAGYYTGRDRAAYWDGRNALGEQVASGLYFYQLKTDEMSLMRKMVILK